MFVAGVHDGLRAGESNYVFTAPVIRPLENFLPHGEADKIKPAKCRFYFEMEHNMYIFMTADKK